MTTVVSQGTPLAEALSQVVPPKLVEMGWSSEGEDSALTEYVILMLVNGKTQEQIAGELSNDLLGLGEGDTQALDFARWLFEQVELLSRQINSAGAPTAAQTDSERAIPSLIGNNGPDPGNAGLSGSGADTEMGDDAMGTNDAIPTEPKFMRSGRQAGRGRILNQINRNLERGADSALHRVRGQSGSGRINTHGRDHTRGGRFNQNGGGRMMNRQMGPMGMQGNHHMGAGAAPGKFMQMSPQDQMHLMALMEEQARMMAQFMPGFMSPAINPAFQPNGPPPASGRSLFERVERVERQPQRSQGNFAQRSQLTDTSTFTRGPHDGKPVDVDMDTNPDGAQEDAGPDSVCRFNLRCTKRDCPYAHQSPAAPEGTAIDVNDVCPFGAACKNKKCTARHPSPAVKVAHQAEALCKFFPNCTNPNCHFKHPTMPLCRNGADCAVPDCKFTHLQTSCKFNPCLNPSCPYKHADGQRGAFADRVWTADSAESSEQRSRRHLSERKFIADEDAPEELIKPELDGATGNVPSQEIVT